MNAKTRRMKEQLERRGGLVGIDEDLPDELAEYFLEQILLSCPDCRAALGPAIDGALNDEVPDRLSGH